jgi:hypothetical protein
MRRFLALVLLLAALPFLYLGAIMLPHDAIPAHELNASERDVIARAARHVGDHLGSTGRYPTSVEFDSWAEQALSPLPLRWTTLKFTPPWGPEPDYSLSFWDGDYWYTWHPRPAGSTRAYTDPAKFFLFGSKLKDLLAFLGTGALLLLAAWRLARPFGVDLERRA